MNEIYWITRLDSINNTALAFLIIGTTVSVMSIIYYLCATEEGIANDIKTSKKLMKMSIPTFVISLLIFIFVPTTKEALAIYGIGGTIDYLKQNPTAKQLPDKCINALDKWVDSWIKENEDPRK